MQYVMPHRPSRTQWSSSGDYATNSDRAFTNAYVSMQDAVGLTIGAGDFTIEAYFRVTNLTGALNKYSTFLAFDRSNTDGDVLDLMFTDSGYGAYVALTFSNGGDQSASANHNNTFTLQLTRANFSTLTHLAFVRRSGTLYAYVNGQQVKLRRSFNSYTDSVSNVTYVLNNIGPRRNTRSGSTGDISKVYTECILTGLSGSARYQGNFTPPIMVADEQQQAIVVL